LTASCITNAVEGGWSNASIALLKKESCCRMFSHHSHREWFDASRLLGIKAEQVRESLVRPQSRVERRVDEVIDLAKTNIWR
jgi:hypothetical protein